MTTPHSSATVAECLRAVQTQGVQRLDAQLLLLHVLGHAPTERGWLLAHDTDPLNAQQAVRLQALAQRRQAGEPLAYLTGHKEFFGLDLFVDARVLVPRPDTETLVGWALDKLKPLTPIEAVLGAAEGAVKPASHGTLLDLGTGSGAIALALKANLPTLQVHATDLSADALAVARANALRLQLDVSFSQGAWFDALPDTTARFDVIVANPPYIADGDAHLAALAHEPQCALTSGCDGLHDIRQIIANAPIYLNGGGWLLLEHGYDQAAAVRQLLTDADFTDVQSRRDLAGIERCSGGRYVACRITEASQRQSLLCPVKIL